MANILFHWLQVYLVVSYVGQAALSVIYLLILHGTLTGWLKSARIEVQLHRRLDWIAAGLLVLYWAFAPVLFPLWLYSFVQSNWGRNRS